MLSNLSEFKELTNPIAGCSTPEFLYLTIQSEHLVSQPLSSIPKFENLKAEFSFG